MVEGPYKDPSVSPTGYPLVNRHEFIFGTCDTSCEPTPPPPPDVPTPPSPPDAPSPPPTPPTPVFPFLGSCGNGNEALGVFPESGVCTGSCGTGTADCDAACQNLVDQGVATLNCDIGGVGNKKCQCSNVGGGTAQECINSPNPGFKCCTCLDAVAVPPPP